MFEGGNMKMRTRSSRLLMFGALQLAAIAIGAAVAVAAEPGSPDLVYGAAHCTRYAPSVVVRDQTNHPDCRAQGSMAAYNPYQTPSYGWRDSNDILIYPSSQWWEIYLFDTSGNVYQYFAGQGYGGDTAGVSSAQTKAQCATSPNNVSAGRCYVNWHD
jgi:hypothetical protein